MIAVKDFYDKWEGVEGKLIDMTSSPILAITLMAEDCLEELYQLKKELDIMQFEPDTKIRGIQTKTSGRVSFEQIKKFAESRHITTSQKYLSDHGAIFSDAYMEKHGLKESD